MKPIQSALPAFVLCSFAAAALAQQTQPPTETPPQHHGTVIFSRSVDDPSQQKPYVAPNKPASAITDADRQAVTFIRYSLDVRLRPAEHFVAVRAALEIRNDSDHALRQLPLQISSTLGWEEIRTAGADPAASLKFAEATLTSDTDHTGHLHEASVELAKPLAPADTLRLDVFYSGNISQDAERLIQIGTPPDIAQASDWDEIATDFVGLRGFGNVVWYPVSSTPSRLGDGDKVFAAIGAARLRQKTATIEMHVTAEVPGTAPNLAVLNGTIEPVTFTPGDPETHVPGIAHVELPLQLLGFQTPSLFLASRQKLSGDGVDIYARQGNEGSAEAYINAAAMVTPLLHTWLGDKPRGQLSVFDLPGRTDSPFEQGHTLFMALKNMPADQLTSPMSHSLSHACFQSPRPWLNEGVAQFLTTLWTEQSRSRDTALAQLDDQRGALALIEPDAVTTSAAAQSPGVIGSSNAIFYRTKATYVLWMLRSIVGDTALQNALKLYDADQDVSDSYFEEMLTRASVGQPGNKELHQFFEDWVYHDPGLPDLSITGVYPSVASAPGTYLVAVDVSNTGNAGASVPVTVSSIHTQVSERLFIPAHDHAVRRLLIQGEPTQVQVNDGIVPETNASVHVEQVHYTTQPAKQ